MSENVIKKIFVILILLSVVSYYFLLAIHFEIESVHTEHCHICLIIKTINKSIDSYSPELFKKMIISMLILFLMDSFYKFISLDKKRDTLIGLKVELLD